MLKISKALSVGHVMDYHKNEYASVSNRYFSEGKLQGEWHGKLAQQFGLSGGVEEEAYERLALGQDPHTGDQLIKHRDTIITRSGEEVEHRAAHDFTFGASKSISAAALVGGDYRIIAAHDAAVKKALDAIEEYTQARLGGNRSPETTGNMAFALFQHDTARPVGGTPDPHLHTHAVGFNMTQATDKIRSLDPKEMFRVQSYATAVYHAEMSVRLQTLGYELKHGRNFSMEIAGFSREYLDSISRRRDQVEEKMRETGLKGAEWGERIAHSSREAKKAWEPALLLEEWRKSAEGIGMDPESIAAEARSRGPRNAMSREEVSLQAHQGITFAKRRLSERTAVMDRYEIVRDALRYGMGSTTVDDVTTAFAKRTATEREFKQVSHYRAHAPGERYITPEMERMERETLQFVRDGQRKYHKIAPDGFTKENLREMYQSDSAAKKLNHGLMRMLWDAINTPDRVIGIQGGAGTGKTTALRPLCSFLEHRGYEVHGLATTTGAARELRSSLGDGKVETMQRFLLMGSPDQKKPRAYFIDESSLVDTTQTYRLFKYLQQHHPEDRVFLVGDKRQHQSIGAGRIFEELQQGGMETFRLDKIVRQKSEELKAVVTEFARGDVKAGFGMLDEQGKIREVPNRNRRFERMAKDFAGSEGATLIISPDNESRQEINDAVRQELKHSGDVAPDVYRGRILANRQDVTNEDRTLAGTYNIGDVIRWERSIKAIGVKKHDYAEVIDTDRLSNVVSIQFEKDRRIFRMNAANHKEHIQIFKPEERSFAVGDRIQFTNPWKAKGIANREFGTITALDSKGRVEMEMQESHRRIRFNLRDMPHVDYGYATTSYSAQGMTVDRAILHFDAGDSKSRAMLDKILAYVATSRARHEVVVYTNDKEELMKVMNKLNLHPKALNYEQVKEYSQGKYDHALSVA